MSKRLVYMVVDTETATLPFANDIAENSEAKKNIAGIVSRKVGTKWMWSIQNEDCNNAEVSSDEE